MTSRIIVFRSGCGYRIEVVGRFGGGFATTRVGDAADVALFIAAQMQRYAASNPHGGQLIAPPEIMDLVPADLRVIFPPPEAT